MMHPLTGAFEFAFKSENLPDGQITHCEPFSVPQLPPELWEQVIDHLQDDLPSLRECSLTCRAWVPAARYHLFYRIGFSSQHDLLRFRDTLDLSELAATDIARYVRCVAIVGLPLCRLGDQYDDGNALLLHDILIRLPNTDTLILDNVDIDVHLPLDYTDMGGGELRPFSHLFPLPDLRVLRLSSVMFHSIHDVARLIAAFTGLSAIGIDRALWWQDNSSSPLWDEERQGSYHTLRNLTRLSLFAVPSPVDLLRRIQRFPSLHSTRHFGWTTYVADEKRLLLWLLHNSTSNVKNMDLVTRYDNELLSDLDGRQYVNVQNLSLMLAASSKSRDAFCASLPPFLSRLDVTNLRTLTLGFSLFRQTDMYWTFVDWAALDDALVQLHARNPAVTVVFCIAFVPAAGLSETFTADVAAPLIEYLPGALGVKMRIGFRCDLLDQTEAGGPLRQGTLRWLLSIEV